MRLADLLDRGEVALDLSEAARSLDVSSLDTDYRYAGYVTRQHREIARSQRYEQQRVPPSFVFVGFPGLSNELQQRLEARRPGTVGQAGRIPGMTPAALALISSAISRGLSSRRVSDDRSP